MDILISSVTITIYEKKHREKEKKFTPVDLLQKEQRQQILASEDPKFVAKGVFAELTVALATANQTAIEELMKETQSLQKVAKAHEDWAKTFVHSVELTAKSPVKFPAPVMPGR